MKDNEKLAGTFDDFIADKSLNNFLTLGMNARINMEEKNSKSVSVKFTEQQKQLLDCVAKNLGQSRSKVIQELIKSYMNIAYSSYLSGLYLQGDLDMRHVFDTSGFKSHLDKDAKFDPCIPRYVLHSLGLTNILLDCHSNELEGENHE